MSQRCQVTGTVPTFGKQVSHSHRRTSRRFTPNIQHREESMAKKNDIRSTVTLRSTAGTGFTYMTTKNRRNTPDRLVMRKFDPAVRAVVEFREER